MDWPAADEKALISVERVSFGYGPQPVLLDVTLRIHPGDFLAIIGPNGSGKTTLLKIILGLLKPDRGRVLIAGNEIEDFSEWPAIGYIPQKATHFDPLFPASAREVVAMALRSPKRWVHFTSREEDAAIRHALRVVGMEDYRNRRIGRLSGGQQQRVFIARAIVNRPKILFLDEPTTGVDAETQGHFYDLLERLVKDEGITIVLITHDIGIVDRHISQVACLNQRLVYHGSHEEFCRSDTLKDMLAGGHHLIAHRH
jgi:zinc transport system ATP-binding protein